MREQHTLIKAIFRSKKDVQRENPIDFKTIDYTEIFIRQLQDIDRNEDEKSDIIKDAIIDYIFCDIEITNIITNNNNFTKHDFEQFEERCEEEWKKIKRVIIRYNLDKYQDFELNDFAIQIFDNIMNDLQIEFTEYFGFNNFNRYIQNGTFLKLSNMPKIGWHPNWKSKYCL